MAIFELRMLGDAVMSIPFVRGAMTDYDVFVCCQPSTAQVYSLILPPERIMTWTPPWGERRSRPGSVGTLRARLRELKLQAAVCAWADTRVHILMAMSGAVIRVGFPMNRQNYLAHERPWRRRQLYAGRILSAIGSVALLKPQLTSGIQRREYRQSHLADWCQLAEILAIPWDTRIPWFNSGPVADGGRFDRVRTFCAEARAAGKKIWALHAGGRLPSKRWPLDRFQELVDTVFVPGGLPLLMIKPPDGICPDSRNSDQRVVETPTIGDLASLVNMADFVVCNDSAVSHIAGALGKKAVTVFSSGSADWFAAHGSRKYAVCSHACPHHPCMDRCVMPSYVCLDRVTVKMVSDAMDSVLSE